MSNYVPYKYTGNWSEQQTKIIGNNFSSRNPSRLHLFPTENIAFHEHPQRVKSTSFKDAYNLLEFVPNRQSVADFIRAADTIHHIKIIPPSGQIRTVTDDFTEFLDTAPVDSAELVFNGTRITYLCHDLLIENSTGNDMEVLETFAEEVDV